MSVLIIAEHHQGHLADNVAWLVTRRRIHRRSGRSAVAGSRRPGGGVNQATAIGGVDKVLLAGILLADGLLDGDRRRLLARWCPGVQPLPDGGERHGQGTVATGGGAARG